MHFAGFEQERLNDELKLGNSNWLRDMINISIESFKILGYFKTK